MTLRYSINLSMLYTEHPFLDRFSLAARAGFRAVEFMFPYEFDLREVRIRLEDQGLKQALFNLHAGDTGAGEWGLLSNPNKRDYFRWSLTNALEVACFLGCSRLNTMFGQQVAGLEREAQVECAIENLSWAAPIADQAGVTLLIEPLNATDFPQYALHSTTEALDIIHRVGHSRVQLQYDLYHAQMTEGNLINTFTKHLPEIGHIQLADVPGRHQPGTGEINYSVVLNALNELDYTGYVGLEYRPTGASDASLAWLPTRERNRE
jgi:hydroxypyruvate isomerase